MSTYPILMYHGIHDRPETPGHYDPVYSVTPSCFGQHLDWLIKNGYRTVLLDEVLQSTKQEKVVVITFDDGDVSNYLLAAPLLEERGMRAEFFVTTGRIGKAGSMTAEQLATLAKRGMSIQSHGVTHRFLSELERDELRYELGESKSRLEQIVGQPVTKLALPGGRGSKRVIDVAQEIGYRAICTSMVGHNLATSNCFQLRRITVYPDTSGKLFQSILTGRGIGLRRLILRQRVLQMAKDILGNRLYERLRGTVVPH